MHTKILYAAIAVIALAIIGLVVYNQSRPGLVPLTPPINSNSVVPSNIDTANTNTEATPIRNTNTANNISTSSDNSSTTGRFSGEADIQSPDIAVFEVSYDGAQFAPNNLSIKRGDIVIFRNSSSNSFWPASGPHPQHTLYPEFDAKKSIGSGQSFQFKFLKTGKWPFHDHLNPGAAGSIVVE